MIILLILAIFIVGLADFFIFGFELKKNPSLRYPDFIYEKYIPGILQNRGRKR